MNLEIRVEALAGSQLVRDYLAGDPEALRWFAGDPLHLASFQAQAERLPARFGPVQRRQAAQALRPTSERARRRLEHFVEHGGAVVTTGQQTGLFTGPLYTVHKILTVVRLAQALEAELGITVLPVFWAASEDHDWAEANHAFWLDERDRLRRLQLQALDTRPLPMSERRLEHHLESTLDEAAQVLSGLGDRGDVIKLLRDAYRPGATVAEAFAELVEELFAPFDLLVTDAADAELKTASRSFLAAELADGAEHERLLRETERGLTASGYRVQVPILEGASNLFVRTSLGRERLFRDRRGWVTRESGTRYAEGELERALATEPVRFSPNVLFRPVVESAVFPVLGYVAGPGETAYWAQIKPLFEAHGLDMPLVYPRASILIVEPRIRRYLERLDLSIERLSAPRHELIARHTTAKMPPQISAALEALRAQLVSGFDDLADLASSLVDPTLGGAVQAGRNRALISVAEAERKVRRAVRRSEAEAIRCLDAALSHLVPLRSRQERVLNVMPLLARHGRPLLAALAARIPIRWRDAAPSVELPDVRTAEAARPLGPR